MLWTIALVSVALWLLGFVSGYTESYFIHMLLFFAIIATLIQMEVDCSKYGDAPLRKTKKYVGRRAAGRLGQNLPKLSILSGEKTSQTNISAETFRE